MFYHPLSKTLLRTLVLVGFVLLAWSVLARPSGAHGSKVVYRVKVDDTLWSIATRHYGGDVRNAIWQIQTANHMAGVAIAPGERLVLP